MKKYLLLVLCLALMAGFATNSFARYERENARDVGYADVASSAADAALVAQPIYIYAVTLRPMSAAGYVKIYDNASAASGTVKIEVSEATQYDSRREVFDPPINMTAGAYADVNNAEVTIEYR